VSGPGIYTLQIANMCSTSADTVIVGIDNTPPDLNLPSSLNLCQNDTLVLDAGISGVQFLWNDGSSLPTLDILSPGAYSLTVSNTCGMDSDTILINDAGPQPVVSLGSDISLCS